MATERVVKWMKFSPPDDDATIVWVDVSKIDEAWRASAPDAYLEQGSGSRETYEYLRDAVKSGAILRMPRLQFLREFPNAPRVSLVDGRHRFSFMRDHGAAALPMTIEDDQAGLVDKYLLAPRGPYVTTIKV
jgi:hypothetical protein